MALNRLWRRVTETKALESSSGKLETAFFESVYRVTYLAGWSNSDFGWLYWLYGATVRAMIGMFIAGELWFLASYDISLDRLIEQASVVVILIIAFIRYKVMRHNQDVFKRLASAMQSPSFDTSTASRKALIEYWRRKNERFLMYILGLGTCTLAVWHVYPLVDDVEYNLMVTVRLPVDYRTPGRYPIAYIVTLMAFNYTAYFIMVNDLILQAYLLHLLCQFEVLVDCFENILVDVEKDFTGFSYNELIGNKDFRSKYLKRLELLTDQHKLILNYGGSNTLELRQILSAPMLLQVTASGMQICFAGYQVALTLAINVTKFLMSCLFLGYNMSQLFIFCRWCDEIKTQSEHIRDAIYCSGWERGMATVPGVRRRLLLVAMRASKPVVLTAGGLYDLSLSSFTTLVKTSYSALTVLLRLRQDKSLKKTISKIVVYAKHK